MLQRCLLPPLVAALLIAPAGGVDDPGRDEWSEPAVLAPQSLLLDATVSGKSIVAVGERGHVLVSADGGATWEQALAPTRSLLTAVTDAGKGGLWAVGHDAVVIRSADGGRTWTRSFIAPEANSPLLDVWFENENHGIAIGAYGLFLETGDGGETWMRRAVDDEERHWNALARGADGTLFAAAEFGTVFVSRDNAKTWKEISTPYEGSFFGALGLTDGGLLIFGLRGNIYRSDDAGETWRRIPSDTNVSLTSGIQSEDGTVIIVGLSGTILVGVDQNRRFKRMERADRLGISAIVENHPSRFLTFGEGGARQCDDLRRFPERREAAHNREGTP